MALTFPSPVLLNTIGAVLVLSCCVAGLWLTSNRRAHLTGSLSGQTSSNIMVRPQVVVIGGGPAGINTCQALSKTACVTLIEPKGFHEINWGALRGMVKPEFVNRLLTAYSDIPDLGRIIAARAVAYDSSSVTLETGVKVPYDYLVLAPGSTYPDPVIKTAAGSLQDRKQAYADEHERLKAANSVLIIGGGPTGVELAAEVAEELSGKQVTLVSSGDRLVADKRPKVGAKSLAHLQKKGVKVPAAQIILNAKAERHPDGSYSVKGKPLAADVTYQTVGARPNTAFLATSAPLDGKGHVKVLPTLQVEGFPKVFAVGDCNNVAETKLGYLAALQAKVAAANITALAFSTASQLKDYKPAGGGPDVMLVSLSRKNGVMQLGPLVFGGFIPTNLKCKDMFVGKTRKDLGLVG